MAPKRRAGKHRARPRHRSPPRSSRPHALPSATSPQRVRLEVDLVHEAFRRDGLPFLHRLEAIFREREVVEVEGLLRTVARVLHALSRFGFDRVDHWEAHPGGWLALPEPAHERLAEPVAHLLNALRSDAWRHVAGARSFSVRLSGPATLRADLLVRGMHRERVHSLTLDLVGRVTDRDVRAIESALRAEVAIVRIHRSVPTSRHQSVWGSLARGGP